jgi:hypothetical protein
MAEVKSVFRHWGHIEGNNRCLPTLCGSCRRDANGYMLFVRYPDQKILKDKSNASWALGACGEEKCNSELFRTFNENPNSFGRYFIMPVRYIRYDSKEHIQVINQYLKND